MFRLVRGGIRGLGIQLLSTLTAIVATWLTYPVNPAMNFMREVPERWLLWFVIATTVGVLIACLRLGHEDIKLRKS
jgi:uncharacterized membrane protein required for colicin V production